MGYESKLYICKRVKVGDLVWNETLAAINMCVMDVNFRALFTNKLDGDFYGADGAMSRFDQKDDEDEPKLVDDYDEELKYTSLDDVLNWCDTYMSNVNGHPRWRIAVLQEMLGSFYNLFKQIGNEQLIVVHYGY